MPLIKIKTPTAYEFNTLFPQAVSLKYPKDPAHEINHDSIFLRGRSFNEARTLASSVFNNRLFCLSPMNFFGLRLPR